MKTCKVILLLLGSLASLVSSAAVKPVKHDKFSSRMKPGRPDGLQELHHVSKKLDHFVQSADSHIAQTLSDISKTLKTIKKNPRSITKEDVEKTFYSIEEITTHLDTSCDEAGLANKSGCKKNDCCKELKKLLCQIKNIIVKCCRHLSAEIEEIKKLINTKFPCAHSIKIDHVPFTIKKPGKYCVTKDLTFGGPGAAITVAVSNVTLNFANHSLTLTDPAAVGISASGISELVIQNDIIQGPASTGTLSNAAILLTDTSKVTIDNVFTLNTYFGIHAIRADDITITNSHFEHHIVAEPDAVQPAAALRAEACTNLTVDACVFKNNASGISFGIDISTVPNEVDGCKNIKLTNSELLNSGIVLSKADGSLIENCQFTLADSTLSISALIKLGIGALVDFTANDTIISNCSVTNANANATFSAIDIRRANGVKIDKSIVDIAGEAFSAILIGKPNGVAKNVTISNSFVTNSSFIIFIDSGSSKVTVDNCLIVGGRDGTSILFNSNSIDNTVKHCTITNCSTGMLFEVGSNNNAVISNTITNCFNFGIFLNFAASNNLIKDNNVFGTGIGIGQSVIGTNQFYFNNACNNDFNNCLNIPPAVVGTPGQVPVTNGMNICCINPPVLVEGAKERQDRIDALSKRIRETRARHEVSG